MRLRSALLAVLLVAFLVGSFGFSMAEAGSADKCKGKNKKQCEVPEVPWALVLPVATASVATGYYLIQRRRHDDAPAQP